MEESMDKYMDFYWILYTRWNDGLLRYVGCNKSLMFSLLKLKNNATILKPLQYLFSNLYLKLLCIYITFSMYTYTKPLFCTFWNPTSLSNLIHFHIPIVISVFSRKKTECLRIYVYPHIPWGLSNWSPTTNKCPNTFKDEKGNGYPHIPWGLSNRSSNKEVAKHFQRPKSCWIEISKNLSTRNS